MEEKNESRVNIEDLPQAEQELTTDEAKEVQGGTDPRILYLGTGEANNALSVGTYGGSISVASGDVNNDGRADIITGAGPGAGPHVKK